MTREEIAKELRALHDAMVFGMSIIPGRKEIQAVYEAAEEFGRADEPLERLVVTVRAKVYLTLAVDDEETIIAEV